MVIVLHTTQYIESQCLRRNTKTTGCIVEYNISDYIRILGDTAYSDFL